MNLLSKILLKFVHHHLDILAMVVMILLAISFDEGLTDKLNYAIVGIFFFCFSDRIIVTLGTYSFIPLTKEHP